MAAKDLVDMAVYAAFAAVPYLDLDILGVIAGLPIIGHLIAWIPYIEPIHLSEVGDATDWVILLILVIVPYVDLEVFKLLEKFGIQGFEAFDVTREGRGDQGSYLNEDGEIVMGDGGVQRVENNRGDSSSSGSLIKKLLLIGGPIVILMFLIGSGYANLATNEIGFQLAGANIDASVDAARQAVQTITCLGNAACFRQWQFNNTQRPGSEERGEEYSLQIEGFSVNDGFPLDTGNRRMDDRVPVGFSVYNPRHGLKGIEARNVEYRIRMYNSDFGSNTVCVTDWIPLGGEYAGNSEGKGTILPGGFATPLGTHQSLTIEDCGLLQPALGIKRKVKLSVKYDYSSQSTLYVDAMSREQMQSLEKRPSFKKSETADTPVKTYVNVESPIFYRQDQDTGSRQSTIFQTKLGFETGKDDIEYKINVEDFKFYDSSKTIDVESADESQLGSAKCEDLERVSGDQYTFSGDKSEFLETRQNNSWFSSSAGPSPARCSMILENPETISPTGETLTMRVDANYTVLFEKGVEGFEAQNTRCGEYNCPLVVPESVADNSDHLIAKCDSDQRIDARRGCDVREGKDNNEWRIINKINDYDNKLEDGETAFLWENFTKNYLSSRDQAIYKDEFLLDQGFGLNEDMIDQLKSENGQYAAILGTGNNIEYFKIKDVLCDDHSKQEYFDIVEKNYDKLPYLNIRTANCGSEDVVEKLAGKGLGSLYQSPGEKYESAKSSCGGVMIATDSGFECRG